MDDNGLRVEYVKLVCSLRDGAVFDLPPKTVQRYNAEAIQPRPRDWRGLVVQPDTGGAEFADSAGCAGGRVWRVWGVCKGV